MINFRYILLGIVLLMAARLSAQLKSYRVEEVPFSTRINDEFSPVYFKNGIVFCSNLKNNSLINYENKNKGLFNIYFAEKKDSTRWQAVQLLSKN